MQAYITRLCWNERRWQKPSGSAVKLENDTFNVEFGFGFEEWLFSSKFEIDSLRYGFVQGVNKSRRRLLGQDITLFFFTIAPNKQRYCVGEIAQCRVLTIDEAITAHNIFEKRGLINEMVEDIVAIEGDPSFIKNKAYDPSLDIANIRYKPEHLLLYRELINIPPGSKLWKYNRYQLIKAAEDQIEAWNQNLRAKGMA